MPEDYPPTNVKNMDPAFVSLFYSRTQSRWDARGYSSFLRFDGIFNSSRLEYPIKYQLVLENILII